MRRRQHSTRLARRMQFVVRQQERRRQCPRLSRAHMAPAPTLRQQHSTLLSRKSIVSTRLAGSVLKLCFTLPSVMMSLWRIPPTFGILRRPRSMRQSGCATRMLARCLADQGANLPLDPVVSAIPVRHAAAMPPPPVGIAAGYGRGEDCDVATASRALQNPYISSANKAVIVEMMRNRGCMGTAPPVRMQLDQRRNVAPHRARSVGKPLRS